MSFVVVVVIIIGIFALYAQLQGTSNATQTALFTRQLAPQAAQFYRGDYTGFDAQKAISLGFVPTNWQKSNAKIEDPSGNTVEIAGTGDAFTITFNDVTDDTCQAVLSTLRGDRLFRTARKNRTERLTLGGNNPGKAYNANPAEIAEACAEDLDSLVLTFDGS
ncbi:type 4 pilus major pilin [Ruegeria sp.]|uniref:type 4 pilus major pilin n=1 Tax=Ruegeria sp. TaxID=1879320 RepID=UPI003AFF73BB